jgi:aryl-alcohol dehydrogenase-like predicted oxidoreductase
VPKRPRDLNQWAILRLSIRVAMSTPHWRRVALLPIPGTTKLKRLDENLGALAVAFTFEDLREIDESDSKIEEQGARYPVKLEHLTGR